MKCQECGKNGIGALRRMGNVFNLSFRCSFCGTEYKLNRGVSFVLSLVLQIAIYFSILNALFNLNGFAAYLGVIVSLITSGLLSLVLPVKAVSRIGRNRDRNT